VINLEGWDNSWSKNLGYTEVEPIKKKDSSNSDNISPSFYYMSVRPTLDNPRGVIERKPWDHLVSVCIPHRDSPEEVLVVRDLYQFQTIEPFILIIDTGSSDENCGLLERDIRNPNTEIHYIRSHGSFRSSQTVAWAIDMALTLCRTEYLFLTHSDMFPTSRYLLEELMGLCSPDNPVVGYAMAYRGNDISYKNIPGHVCTMLHVPTIIALGLRYGFAEDTEMAFGASLKAKGVKPMLIGTEINQIRQTDSRIDHCRSVTSLKMSRIGLPSIKDEDLRNAMRDARERVVQWKKECEKYSSAGFPR
jgi:hypothetical protein